MSPTISKSLLFTTPEKRCIIQSLVNSKLAGCPICYYRGAFFFMTVQALAWAVFFLTYFSYELIISLQFLVVNNYFALTMALIDC